MTANSNMTVSQMKDYIRKHKLNKPHLRLSMKRGEMIAGFKKEGRWKDVAKVKKTRKATVKKAPVKKSTGDEKYMKMDRTTPISIRTYGIRIYSYDGVRRWH